MATPVVQYDSREMLAAMRQAPRPTTFLQDLFIRNRTFHTTKNLEIDIVKGGETIAPYVSRKGAPTVVGKKGYDTLIHLAPYLYDEITYEPSDADERTPSETIYDTDANQAIDTRRAVWLADLQDRFIRREEQQLAEAIQTGKVDVDGKDVEYEVDFQMPATHIKTLTGADIWGSGTEKKIDQFEAWSTQIQDTGAPAPDVCVLDLNAGQLLRKDTDFLALLNNRRVLMGEINPRQLYNQRATYLGNLAAAGVDIDFYVYQGSYVNDSATRVRYVGTDNLILGSTAARTEFHYSKIENFNSSFIGRQFPMMGIEPKGKLGFISLESGPLVGLHQPEAFITVNVK